jgi:hypothetical protein
MLDTSRPGDPITFAVVKNAMDAIVDEVAYTVIRTARSEIVKDVMDYSAAICDAKGEMVAQAKTIAQHLGAIPEAMAAVQSKWGGRLEPGDAFERARIRADVLEAQPVCAAAARGEPEVDELHRLVVRVAERLAVKPRKRRLQRGRVERTPRHRDGQL